MSIAHAKANMSKAKKLASPPADDAEGGGNRIVHLCRTSFERKLLLPRPRACGVLLARHSLLSHAPSAVHVSCPLTQGHTYKTHKILSTPPVASMWLLRMPPPPAPPAPPPSSPPSLCRSALQFHQLPVYHSRLCVCVGGERGGFMLLLLWKDTNPVT